MPIGHERIFSLQFWQRFWEQALTAAAENGLKIIIILLLYWIARKSLYRLIDATLARLVARQTRTAGEERGNRLLTLQGLVKSIVGYLLFFILIIMLLDTIGTNVSGIITTAGIGGLAFGFGAQKLVRDVISGFFLIIEDQFAVGDYVTIGAATGVVQEMGMRITRIRDDQGRLWILSNGDISTVTNHSRAPVAAFIEVGVAPGADLDKAESVINAVGADLFAEQDHSLLAAPQALGVSAFDAARTTIRVTVVSDPRALAGEQIRVRTALLDRLRSEGVQIA